MQVDVEYEEKKQIKSQKIKLEANNQIKQEMETICAALEIKEPAEQFYLLVKSSENEIEENILVKHAFIKYNLRNETIIIRRKPLYQARVVLANLDPKASSAAFLKSTAFQLKGYLANSPEFAEEFISNGGIRKLLEVITNTKGSTQAYALSALAEALTYADGMETVLAIPEIVRTLWGLLSSGVVSVQRAALEVLIVLCHLCGDLRGFNLLHTAATQDAKEKGKEPYECLMRLLSSKGDWETTLNALTLLNLILVVCPSESLVQQLVADWEKNFKISHILITEIAKMQQEEFHTQLDIYEMVTGVMVRTQTDRLLHENLKLQKKLQKVERQIKKKTIKSLKSDKNKGEMDRLTTLPTTESENTSVRQQAVCPTINLSSVDDNTTKLLTKTERDDQERMVLRRRVQELERLVKKLRGDSELDDQSLPIDLEKTILHVRDKRGASNLPQNIAVHKSSILSSAEIQSSVPSNNQVSSPLSSALSALSTAPSLAVGLSSEFRPSVIGMISETPFQPLLNQSSNIVGQPSDIPAKVSPGPLDYEWTPIIKSLERKREKTIWDTLPSVKINFTDLEVRFGPRKDEKNKETLNEYRVREINWLLIKIPLLSNVTNFIDEFRDSTIPLTFLKILEKTLPTSEEVDIVKKRDPQKLSSAEKFILEVASIPLFKEQLQCWTFKKEYPFIVDNISVAISKLGDAIRAIQNSSTFRQLLSIVLCIGNKLFGTEAIGFRIEFLNRLKQIRDGYNQNSLLEYVLQVAEQNVEDFHDRLQLELMDPIEKASKMKLKEVELSLKELQSRCKFTKDVLEAYGHQKSKESLFYQEFIAFLLQIQNEIELLRMSLENINKTYNQMLLSFAYDVAAVPLDISCPEHFFGELQQFLNDLRISKEILMRTEKRQPKVSLTRTGFRGKIGTGEQTATDILGKLNAGEGVYRFKPRTTLVTIEPRSRRENIDQGNILKETNEETKEVPRIEESKVQEKNTSTSTTAPTTTTTPNSNNNSNNNKFGY